MIKRLLPGIKLHASTSYRLSRGLSKKAPRNGFGFKYFPTRSVEEINDFLAQFELFIVCSQNLDLWVLDPDSVQEDKDGSASPQRTEVHL
jgi:hypothetical protein